MSQFLGTKKPLNAKLGGFSCLRNTQFQEATIGVVVKVFAGHPYSSATT